MHEVWLDILKLGNYHRILHILLSLCAITHLELAADVFLCKRILVITQLILRLSLILKVSPTYNLVRSRLMSNNCIKVWHLEMFFHWDGFLYQVLRQGQWYPLPYTLKFTSSLVNVLTSFSLQKIHFFPTLHLVVREVIFHRS